MKKIVLFGFFCLLPGSEIQIRLAAWSNSSWTDDGPADATTSVHHCPDLVVPDVLATVPSKAQLLR
jgi:hypothetical protein